MKKVFKLFFWLLVLTPFALAAALFWSIEDYPVVSRQVSMTPDQVKRAKTLVGQHDPRRAREGEIKSVSLSAEELNLILSYLLDALDGAAAVSVEGGWLDMLASVRVPRMKGRFLNFKVGLTEGEVLPRFRYLELGKVPVPKGIADYALEKSLDALYSRPGYAVAEDVIQKVALADNRVELTYKWHAEIADVVRSTLVTDADQDRLRVFQHSLAEVVGSHTGRKVALAEIVQPLFALAASRAEDGDAVADNRAALVVLSAYVNGRDLAKLAPDVKDWKRARRLTVLAHGRDDLPKHYLTSAGLAVTAGSTLSQAIGLFKELDDSRGGSGFSFPDLLADNAGTRLGEVAVTSRRAALGLQSKLARSVSESDLIPDVSGLPEGLTEQQFKQKYADIGSPAYEEVVRVIDERIAASPLYN